VGGLLKLEGKRTTQYTNNSAQKVTYSHIAIQNRKTNQKARKIVATTACALEEIMERKTKQKTKTTNKA